MNLLGKYISSVKHSTGTTNTRKEVIANEWKQKLKAQNPGGEQENRPGQKKRVSVGVTGGALSQRAKKIAI